MAQGEGSAIHPPADDRLTAIAELRRGWRPLLACSVGIGLGLSPLPPFTAGLFATALQHEFGWARGDVLAAILFVTVALVVLSPLVGRLVDRHGARRIAIASTVGLGLSLASLSLATAQIWTFYLGWAAMAVVALGTLPITYAPVINGWFDRARGIAFGIALASTGVTGALAPFYVQWIIAAHGWRAAYLGLAALPLMIALPVLWLFLREPERAIEGRPVAAAQSGQTVRQALAQPRFWALSVAALALGAGTGGLIPNLVPLMTEGGLAMPQALQAMAALAISVIVGRLLTGYLLDRLWGSLVGVLLIAPAGLALGLLGTPSYGPTLIAAITIGLIAGAEFDLVAYMTSRYFGRRHFGAIYAIQYAVFGLGAGGAPAAYGAIRDATGSYRPLLILSAALFAASIAALLTLGRYPASVAEPRDQP